MKKLIYGLILLTAYTAFGALSEPDRALIPPRNLLVNPGFELGTAKWTASAGTLSTTTSSVAVGSGVRAGTWAASGGAGRTLKAGLAIPAGLFGKSGVVSCNIRTPSGTATHTLAATDTTNILSSQTITSNSNYVRTSVNFIFPSSGSIELRLTSVSSSEPLIDIDDCYLGGAQGFNLTTSVILSSEVDESALWTFDNLGTPTSVKIYSRLVGDKLHVRGSLVTGTIVSGTFAINIPSKYSLNTSVLPSTAVQRLGTLLFFNAAQKNFDSATDARTDLFYDGSTAGKIFASYVQTAGAVYAKIDPTTATGSNNPVNFEFEIPIVGPSTGSAFTPDKLANSWSGYQTVSAGCAGSGTTYTDTSSCTLALTELTNNNFGTVANAGSGLPGILFTPSRAGTYKICATVNGNSGGTNPVSGIRMVDGSNNIISGGVAFRTDYFGATVCGIKKVTSTSPVTAKIQVQTTSGTFTISNNPANGSDAAMTWDIFQIDQSIPSPLIVNSVVSSSNGVEVFNRARIASGCATVTTQSGNWIGSLTHNATGDCTANFTAGTFSAAPVCTCTSSQGNPNRICSEAIATTAGVEVFTWAGGADDEPIELICMGPK